MEGEGVPEAGRELCGSEIISLKRNFLQYIEAASGSRAIMSCLGFSTVTNPAYYSIIERF